MSNCVFWETRSTANKRIERYQKNMHNNFVRQKESGFSRSVQKMAFMSVKRSNKFQNH